MNTLHYGTLYGIGVGPGDPDLIPLKSVKIINRVDVIFEVIDIEVMSDGALTSPTCRQSGQLCRRHWRRMLL